MAKISERELAIQLRKQGKSYSEILRNVPVAKSTLSLWLGSVGLSKRQKQRLTEKRLIAARKGGEAKKNERILLTKKIQQEAEREIEGVSLGKKELWLLGTMLYWAEGSKEKIGWYNSGVQFSNSDPKMVRLFLKWLFDICKIKKDDIQIDIFIHEHKKNDVDLVVSYWSTVTGFPSDHFKHIYFKKNKLKTNRKNTGTQYYGLVKVKVRRSTNLLRKICGWVDSICKKYKIH